MYAKGEGVKRNRTTVHQLYRAAAEGGVADAQIIVGLDYADDSNLPVDLVQAYRWLTVASSSVAPGRDLADVIELRERARTRLTIDQLAEARRMVLEGNGNRRLIRAIPVADSYGRARLISDDFEIRLGASTSSPTACISANALPCVALPGRNR